MDGEPKCQLNPTSRSQSCADAKVFAFVRLRAPDTKPFCQSSACVPELLLRFASVCMGEGVNTLGRTVPFLVAKALNFKIRENLCLCHVFCVRVELRLSRPCCVFCIRVFLVPVFLRTVVSSPIASTESIRVRCAKDAKDATRTRRTQLRCVCPALLNPSFE